MIENNVVRLLLRRVACEPSHPSCSAASSTAVEERARTRLRGMLIHFVLTGEEA
jgi:hypothetical protein